MKDKDLDKEIREIIVLKEKLPEAIQKAIEIANSIPDITFIKNKYIFVNSNGGTDANS